MEDDKRAKAEDQSDGNLDLATAQSTYKIISVLLEQVEHSSNLIAIMAGMMGEDMSRQIAQTEAWANYLQGRRSLEAVNPELKRFADTVNKLLAEDRSSGD